MNLQTEVFVPVKGFEGRYEISSFGRVRASFKCGTIRVLKNYLGTWGYYTVHLGRKSRTNLVHRIVAQHFVLNSNPEKFIHVNHLDGNKTNNLATNLEWCDRSRNMTHALENGLNRGVAETSRFAKLSNKDVVEIKNAHAKGVDSQKTLAAMYNIHPSQVSKIVNNKRRKYG